MSSPIEIKNSVTSYIKIYDNAIPSELCDKLVNLYDKMKRENSSEIEKMVQSFRTCSLILLSSLNNNNTIDAVKQLKIITRTYFYTYKQEVDSTREYSGVSTLHFCNLLENMKQQFHNHSDNWSLESTSRQISIIYYLNDVEEGGRTIFPSYNVQVKPKKDGCLCSRQILCSYIMVKSLNQDPNISLLHGSTMVLVV